MSYKRTFEEILARQNNSKPRKRPSDEEHRIQCACVRWFNLQYPEYRGLLHSVPNGGARSKATAGKLKAEGVVAGVSDLELKIARHGYHGLCIEMKTPEGRQSPEQKQWQKKVETMRYKYVICRSLDDFIREVSEYLSTI